MSAERFKRTLSLFALLLLLSGCSGDPGAGPVEVKWDRDACERCRMVLSDRMHSAEIRYYPQGKTRSTVAKFDDIGCASLWLDQQPFRNDPRTELWVTDHRTGEWIDARAATYVTGNITPMEYGLGAQSDPAEGGMSYEQAREHFAQVEERFNIHGVHLLERLQEQARQRELNAPASAQTDTLPPIKSGAE